MLCAQGRTAIYLGVSEEEFTGNLLYNLVFIYYHIVMNIIAFESVIGFATVSPQYRHSIATVSPQYRHSIAAEYRCRR